MFSDHQRHITQCVPVCCSVVCMSLSVVFVVCSAHELRVCGVAQCSVYQVMHIECCLAACRLAQTAC